jgi:importin-5
LEEEDI